MFRRAIVPPPATMTSRPSSKLHAANEPDHREVELSTGVHDESPLITMQDISSGGGWSIMGLQLSPEIIAIAMVYFSQGILKLSKLGMSFFLKVGVSPSPPPRPLPLAF